MSWNDAISIGLSVTAIIVSCITSLFVVFPHTYIHSICCTENKYILLLIANNGFSPGMLFTEFGITYRKKNKRHFIQTKRTTFKPNILLSSDDMKLFWNGNFLKQIEPQKAVFLVLDQKEVLDKLKEITSQGVTKVQFYATKSSLLRKNHTRKILSPSQKVKELIKAYENNTY